jgi:hypothetical protein
MAYIGLKQLDPILTGSLQVSGSAGFTGSLSLRAGDKLFTEADEGTYLQSDSADRLRAVVGGSQMLLMDQDDGRVNIGYGQKLGVGLGNNTTPGVELEVDGDVSGSGLGSFGTVYAGTHITASGNISGSSTSTGSFGKVEATTLRGGRLEFDGATDYLDVAFDGSLYIVSAGDVHVEPGGGELNVNANVVPDTDSADDLGSTSKYWRNAYIDSVTTTGNVSGSSTSHLTMGQISSSGDVVADGDIIAYNSSDERLKDNIQVIKGSLDKIGEIRGVEFDWNEKSPGWARERGHDVGVIAQEVQKVIPEIVVERKNGFLGVDYKRLVPLLIESIKELKQEVEDLKKKVN